MKLALALFATIPFCSSLLDVEQQVLAVIKTLLTGLAVLRSVPVWAKHPYWYTNKTGQAYAAIRQSLPSRTSGLVRIGQEVKGLPVVLDLLINERQARKINEVLRGGKSFCVIKNYVFHHGPGAPGDVCDYLVTRPSMVVVSCNGKSHPYYWMHIRPTGYPLAVGLTRHDRGWRLVVQDMSVMYN